MGEIKDDRLVEMAKEARTRAYAPYSRYLVGAALQATSGKIYTGCNVENAVHSVGLCAERVAICKAISEGDREFEAIAVVTTNGGTPCGSCRQVMAEFNPHLRVIVADLKGNVRVYTLDRLLPDHFGPANLKESSTD